LGDAALSPLSVAKCVLLATSEADSVLDRRGQQIILVFVARDLSATVAGALSIFRSDRDSSRCFSLFQGPIVLAVVAAALGLQQEIPGDVPILLHF